MLEEGRDPHGNIAFVRELADTRMEFPPREVDSVASLYGGFGQSKILVAGEYEGFKHATNGGHLNVTPGSSSQSAHYLFSLENGHGLGAEIFGDGKIVLTFMSQGNETVESDFEGLVKALGDLNRLDAGPFRAVKRV